MVHSLRQSMLLVEHDPDDTIVRQEFLILLATFMRMYDVSIEALQMVWDYQGQATVLDTSTSEEGA